MKKKLKFADDFKQKIDSQWYEDAAISHIECWKSRYIEYKSKKQIEFDLNTNHDPSLEIESAEELLDRKLTEDETENLIANFNKAVLENINLKTLRYS